MTTLPGLAESESKPTPSPKPMAGRFSAEKLEDSRVDESSLDKVGEVFDVPESPDQLHRALSNRKVQLVAIGSSIGTALFLSIGGTLNKAGPGSLFLAFLIYSGFLALINNCMAEMTVYMPVSGNFTRMAGKWVDEALGFCAGWNFLFYQLFTAPFEITALSFILSYWSDAIPVAAICGGCIVLYFIFNVYAVSIYGEAEFWLSSGKVFLLIVLLSFTFITMVGGNPEHDAYGFRYWKSPGAFEEYSSTGTTGLFEGFLVALWAASFTCVGPEFVGMMASEAQHPRTYVKTAFKFVYARIVLFFIGTSLAVGILVPYNDATLDSIYKSGGNTTTAAASPFIIAMKNLKIQVLPDLVTALLATTIFSAGNASIYYSTRSLYGLALEGRAPAVLKKVTKRGIPIYCFLLVMIFPFLSFLQLSNGSATVLTWLINLATGTTIINQIIICITYVSFYRACLAQNFDRTKLPYVGRFQPYAGWMALAWEIMIVFCYGYKSLRPFDVSTFITDYFMPLLMPCLFLGWKLIHKTKWLTPEEVDLVWQAPAITAYEENCEEAPIGFFRDIYQSLKRGKDTSEPRV